jgi:hypothetical protein
MRTPRTGRRYILKRRGGFSSLARTYECVIASEAKQSRVAKRKLDCFVASLLAMTHYALVRFRLG